MSLNFDLYIDIDSGSEKPQRMYFCEQSITHNLTEMAKKAGVYEYLWRPEENGFKVAKDIIEPLAKGLQDLKARPNYFAQFNSPNGWGTYEHFVPFVERILTAAEKHPKALIRAWR